jgi:chemotaxis protein MotB
MAGDAKKLQPIIIKRVKKGGHGAHGGAWKIAYADFVTAMMAFFLLMWLLGSTTEGDKKGISDYFNTPLKVALLQSGSGSGDSSSVVKGGGQDMTRTTGQVKRGEVDAKRSTLVTNRLKDEQTKAEMARLEDIKRKIKAKIDASEKLKALGSQIRMEMTDDGLRIQIIDEEGRPMFASGSAVVQPYMRELLREIGTVLASVPNRLTLEGHTDAVPFPGGDRGYSNWELSADRANASRRELLAGGLPEDQVLRVQGLAASNPFDRTDATAASNRRISLVVMTREAEDNLFRSSAAVAVPNTATTAATTASTATTATTATTANGPATADPSIKPELPAVVSSPRSANR